MQQGPFVTQPVESVEESAGSKILPIFVRLPPGYRR